MQLPDQLGCPGGIFSRKDIISLYSAGTAGEGFLFHAIIIAQQRFPVFRRGGEVGDGTGKLAVHCIAEGEQGAVRPAHRRPFGAGLFVDEPDCPDQVGIGTAVAGVPVFQPLAGVIAPAVAVEGPGLLGCDTFGPFQGDLAVIVVDRFARRVEEKGVEGTHLVGIDHQLRMPFVQCLHPGTAFRLGEDEPVAVEVEQVVIGASPGPYPGVVDALGIAVGHGAAPLLHRGQESLPAVGIFHRVDAHQQFPAKLCAAFIRAGSQLISHLEGGVGAGEFISVNAVHHPGHRREICDQRAAVGWRGAARVGEAGQFCLNRFQAVQVGFVADHHIIKRALFMGEITGFEQAHPGRGFGQRFEVSPRLGMTHRARAEGKTEHRFRGGNARRVAAFGVEWQWCVL